MIDETQIMADRAEGKLMSQKESLVLRPGERTRRLGVTVGDSGEGIPGSEARGEVATIR